MMNNHPAVMHWLCERLCVPIIISFASAEFGAEELLEQEFSHYAIRALDSEFF